MKLSTKRISNLGVDLTSREMQKVVGGKGRNIALQMGFSAIGKIKKLLKKVI